MLLDGAEQVAAELAGHVLRTRESVPLQKPSEEPLSEILGVLYRSPLSADVEVDGLPVHVDEASERVPRLGGIDGPRLQHDRPKRGLEGDPFAADIRLLHQGASRITDSKSQMPNHTLQIGAICDL
jgi:hypothetical protein